MAIDRPWGSSGFPRLEKRSRPWSIVSFRARKPFSVNISARANATLSRSQLSFLKLKTLLSIADCKGPNSPLNWCRFSSFSGEVGRAHLRCRFRLVHDPARELLRRSLHLRQYRQLLRLRGVSCALCSDSPPSTWLCSRYCLYPVPRVNRVQMNYKMKKKKEAIPVSENGPSHARPTKTTTNSCWPSWVISGGFSARCLPVPGCCCRCLVWVDSARSAPPSSVRNKTAQTKRKREKELKHVPFSLQWQ